MKSVFAIVVGQGLAGTAVAWSLQRRGLSVHVVDEEKPGLISEQPMEQSLSTLRGRQVTETSSRVAAGLMTPITGQRLVKAWRWEEAFEIAKEHYEAFENASRAGNGCRVLTQGTTLRLFDSEAEKQKFESRLAAFKEPLIDAYSSEATLADESRYSNEFGGFVMPSAKLDTEAYLSQSRRRLDDASSLSISHIDIDRDIRRRGKRFIVSPLEIEADHVVVAQGSEASTIDWFPGLPLAPVQGDILTLEMDGLVEPRTVQRGVWLTRAYAADAAKPNRYLVGSSHRRESLDGRPSLEGRREILAKLEKWLKLPFEVVDHRAAIRPGSYDQKPLLGESRTPGVWILNGLGSKGALYAPLMAGLLVDAIEGKSPIPDELRWDRRDRKG